MSEMTPPKTAPEAPELRPGKPNAIPHPMIDPAVRAVEIDRLATELFVGQINRTVGMGLSQAETLAALCYNIATAFDSVRMKRIARLAAEANARNEEVAP